MTQVYGEVRPFPVSSFTAAPYLRVKHNGASNLQLAGDDYGDVGTLEERVLSGDEYASVRLQTAGGTRKCVAASAVAVGAVLYAAASGKVDDTGTKVYGRALTATTAADQVVEVLLDRSAA